MHRPLADGERLGKRRDALGGELRPDAAADVDGADPRGVRLPDLHRVPGSLHQVAVVDDEDLAVGRLLDVELDVVGLLVSGEAERGQRVLRGRFRRPAVRDHRHLLAPAGRYRREEDEGGDGEDRDGGRRGEEAGVLG